MPSAKNTQLVRISGNPWKMFRYLRHRGQPSLAPEQSYNGVVSRRLITALFAAVLLLTGVIPCAAQELSRRLILKDGSYQSVTKYEVKGDRVRYFSAEREEWEELPSSLVDWPATEKYEKDRAAGASAPEAVQFDNELEHEREVEEAAQPQVAPGLRLPEDSGVFLLDTFKSEPQLVEIQQTTGDVDRNTRGNILRGALNPIGGIKQKIELEGAHAVVQSHVDVPSFYINAGPPLDQSNSTEHPAGGPEQPQQPQQRQQPQQPFDRFHIILVEVKGGKRIVGDVKRAVSGKISEEQHFVPTTVSRLSGGWLKITPTASLATGEYAIVEMVGKDEMNMDLWDFGVNPKASANPNPWKPETKTSPPAASKTDESPK